MASRAYREERAPRVLVSVAAVAVVALDVLYIALVQSQDGSPPPAPLVSPFIAVYLGVVAALLGISLFASPATKAAFRGAASGGLLVLAVLAALSIGAAVLVAAIPCVIATVLTVRRTPTVRIVVCAGAGIAVAAATLVGGLWFAWSVAG